MIIIKKYNKSDLSDVRTKLTVMQNEITPSAYLGMAAKLNADAIEKAKKSEIDYYSREIVTTLVNLGINWLYLKESVQELFFRNSEIISNGQFF